MTVFVMRKGRCVKKTARNANDAPFVISDTMEPTRHMASGKYHTSKHKFRQDTKDAGCVELGSEVLKPRKRIPLSQEKRVEDIKRTIYELQNGIRRYDR